jgi:hypothetical protein
MNVNEWRLSRVRLRPARRMPRDPARLRKCKECAMLRERSLVKASKVHPEFAVDDAKYK